MRPHRLAGGLHNLLELLDLVRGQQEVFLDRFEQQDACAAGGRHRHVAPASAAASPLLPLGRLGRRLACRPRQRNNHRRNNQT